MALTRREFGKLALTALPAASVMTTDLLAQTTAKPNSLVAGVQIGLNVPYSFGNNNLPGDDTLANCVSLGVSALELRSQPVEAFLGRPALPTGRGATPEAWDEIRKWREQVSLDKVKAFRDQYERAGVLIQIVKFDRVPQLSEGELDYAFRLSKALGARAISCEISKPDTARLGKIADKHQMFIGYHGHAETSDADWEAAFAEARFNGANVDIGHYIAGHSKSPIPFIEKHHDRITHLHIKDRKKAGGANVPFGEGDTPIKEVLQLLRSQKWPIQATIEFEYPVPEGSTRMAEIAKAIAFCRAALA
jgi:hypothetical protein